MILNEITKLANFSLKFEFKKQKTTTKQQVEFDPDGVDEDGQTENKSSPSSY